MPLRKKKSQRLAISTGDNKETGAQGRYIRKLRTQEAKADIKGKSAEEKRLEAEIFGLDYSNEDDGDEDGNALDISMDWLGQQRNKKLKLDGVHDTPASEDEGDELRGLEDHEVRYRYLTKAYTQLNWSSQLFTLDEPAASTSKILDQPTRSDETSSEQEESEAEDEGDEDDDIRQSEDEEYTAYASLKGKEPAKKKSLWTDEADENITVSLQGTKRLRKLRSEAAEDIVSGAEYERKLRQQ